MESVSNYGQELGKNLVKLAKKLLKNQNLCKLLINTDLDPLNPSLHSDIENTLELFGKNIRIIPQVTEDETTVASRVVMVFGSGTPSYANPDIETISILIYVYVPYKEWIITGDEIRPFAIMSEIRQSLQDRKINGLGEIQYEGFDISSLTNQTGSFLMRFSINAFN